MGNYDQCVSINKKIGQRKNMTFKGQYCLAPLMPVIVPENPYYSMLESLKDLYIFIMYNIFIDN